MSTTSCLHGRTPLVAALALAGCIPQVAAPEGWDGRPPRAAARTAPAARPSPADPATPPPVPAPPPPPPLPSAWTARRVVADARTVPASTHVVRDGETLQAIGERTGVGGDAIARANRLSPPYAVRAGDRLRVPGGRYHLVRQGDTGVAIARAYGVPWATVATLNDLQPPYVLRAGERLALPSATQVAAMPVEDRARAFQIDIDDLVTGGEPAVARRAPATPAPARTPRRPAATATAAATAATPAIEPPRFAGRFDWPLAGAVVQRFGPAPGGRRSDGINIAATQGAPIRAAADGVVAYAGTAVAIYGGLVLIRHGDGWITAYGHADRILVARGQAVRRGDVIARAGTSGAVDRPQLHFEIRDKRTPVDPLRYLPAAG